MLLRLSRFAFWVAAAAAAVGLLAPGGHETLWTVLAGVGSLAAFVLWRSGVREETANSRLMPPPEPDTLDGVALADASTSVQRTVEAAPTFEAALHAVAALLRSELGARGTAVYAVNGCNATHARISAILASHPGFRTIERSLRLDAMPLGVAIASGQEAGELPGNLALPVLAAESVVAAIELIGVDIAFDAAALGELLRSSRCALSHCAGRSYDSAKTAGDTQFVIVPATPDSGAREDGECNREPGADDQSFRQPGQSAGTPAVLSTPDAGGGAGADEPPVLDRAALARLTELDPTGANKLLERVLQAFQTSVARLRPQAEAARHNGDRSALRLVAHTLKSSSASIGALRLSALCAQIESIIRQDTDENLEPYHVALDIALDEALTAIDLFLKTRT